MTASSRASLIILLITSQLLAFLWCVSTATSSTLATNVNTELLQQQYDEEGIDEYRVDLAGISSAPCGSLLSAMKPCNDIWLALETIVMTSSNDATNETSEASSKLSMLSSSIIVVAAGLYQRQWVARPINITNEYNITITGIKDNITGMVPVIDMSIGNHMYGGWIISGAVQLTLNNLHIINNRYGYWHKTGSVGGVLSLIATANGRSSLTINSCVFTNHTISEHADRGGIVLNLHGLSSLVIRHSIIANNTLVSAQPSLCSISTVVMASGGYVEISDSVFEHNYMVWAGAAAMNIQSASHVTLYNVVISQNRMCHYVHSRVEPTLTIANSLKLMTGASIGVFGSNITSITISDSVITQNSIHLQASVAVYGAGISLLVPELHIGDMSPSSLSRITDGVSSNIRIERSSFNFNNIVGGQNISGAGLYINQGRSLSLIQSSWIGNDVTATDVIANGYGGGMIDISPFYC
jgi:hypothetical protein